MKNEKINRRTRGWAWRKHSILFGKLDPNGSESFVDTELELLQTERAIKDNSVIST